MKNNLNPIALGCLLTLASGQLLIDSCCGQSLGETSVPATTGDGNNNQVTAVNVKGDGGIEAVQLAQASPDGEHFKAGVTAKKVIDAWLEKDSLVGGWDGKKQRFIAVGIGEFNSEDPTINPDKFCRDREIALQRALLDARASIVEFANSKMDVSLQADTPGTDLNAKFGEQLEQNKRRLEAQQKTIADLLAEVDKRNADELAGVTAGDRADALMDAAIKKLDATYSTQKINEEKKNKLEKAKSRYEESKSALAKLQEEIKKNEGSVTRSFKSKVSKLAKMPLFGSTCIYQTESWDSSAEQYQVAVALVWSVGLEKATRAIIQGQEVVIDKPKKGTTLKAWLQDQDLGAMVGPRTYMDENGQRHFLGVAARPIVAQASQMERNRDMARLQADGMTVLSLRADVEVAKTAETMSQTATTSDQKEDEKSMDSLSKKIQAKIEGQNINGLGKVYETELNHTLTGIKMLVTVSGIDPDAVKAARTMEEINYAAAIAANKENSRLQGRKDQLEASKHASVNDAASYNKGRKDAVDGLANQEAGRQAEQKKREDQSKQAQSLKAKETRQGQTLDGATGSKPKQADDF
jgi:hypothetical protein